MLEDTQLMRYQGLESSLCAPKEGTLLPKVQFTYTYKILFPLGEHPFSLPKVPCRLQVRVCPVVNQTQVFLTLKLLLFIFIKTKPNLYFSIFFSKKPGHFPKYLSIILSFIDHNFGSSCLITFHMATNHFIIHTFIFNIL